MADEVQKKGMSKGCLIALIVAGVVVLLAVIAAVTCYMKRDDLARYGAVTMVNGIKAELNRNPVAGVDTVRFNAVADAFVEKLNETKLDYDKFGRFMQTVQTIMNDKAVDSGEAEVFVKAMLDYFPELEELLPAEAETDTTETTDSL
jgi:flagellar basal body-associated protein FliL